MLKGYLAFIKSLIEKIPFNAFDYAIFGALAFYVFEDASFGLVAAASSLATTLLSFFVGLIFYSYVSRLLVTNASLTKGIADAVGFLIVVFLSFFVLSIVFSFLRKKFVRVEVPERIDKIGGALLGCLSFFFIASFTVSLLLSFPTSTVIKDSVRNSLSGQFLFSRTQGMDNTVKKVFGGAIEDTINFLTVRTGSNESVKLNFRTTSYKLDQKSEKEMLDLVNQERTKVGARKVVLDEELASVARSHAKDMLMRGYFSHYTPEGLSPFDRMAEANIIYQFAGENLAFAPDVTIAMDGLMKSPGHRANILSKDFGRLGIGVLDAGIYGKMFVQEFTD